MPPSPATAALADRPILVTGGAGFIGSAFVRRAVLDLGRTVVNVDRLSYAGNLESLAEARDHPRHRFEQHDVADEPAIAAIFARHEPAVVVHLAAESHVDRSIDDAGAFVRTNVLGTHVMLAVAHRYWRALPAARASAFRFLHVSTDEVYGSLGAEGKFTERSRYAPNSPYAATKAGADHLVRAWAHTYGFPAIVTNCSNNYGPYQFPEKLIPLNILKAIAGEPMPVYGRGENVRDWLYVEDHVEALLRILDAGELGETYLIGGEGERRNVDVARAIADLVDELVGPIAEGRRRHDLITFVTDRPGHDLRYAIDARKVRSELGWTPRESFPSGLRKTVRWYLDNAHWWTRVQSGRYRGERLGRPLDVGERQPPGSATGDAPLPHGLDAG